MHALVFLLWWIASSSKLHARTFLNLLLARDDTQAASQPASPADIGSQATSTTAGTHIDAVFGSICCTSQTARAARFLSVQRAQKKFGPTFAFEWRRLRLLHTHTSSLPHSHLFRYWKHSNLTHDPPWEAEGEQNEIESSTNVLLVNTPPTWWKRLDVD